MVESSFLRGGGEMGHLTREYNWDISPVGNPDLWPQSLRTVVAIILSSKFPMFLWWGDDMIQFYNDAYRPSLGNQGKHPMALGQRGEDCWPEIWPNIKPLIDQVINNEEAVWRENQLLPICRNGRLEDVYWTFSYSPVLTECYNVGGVLVVCQEVSELVKSRKIIEQSESRFRSIVEQAPMAIALFRGIDMIIEVGNELIFDVWGKDKSIKGMTLIDALPEIEGQGFLELLQNVYHTSVPYIGQSMLVTLNRKNVMENVYFDFAYTPLRDEDGLTIGVMVMANEVTEKVLSRQELERSENRYKNLAHELDEQVSQRTQQLQDSIFYLKRSNENLQQFAYVASHDLQEPLRKIQTFGDLLKRRFSDSNTNEADYVNRMQLSATRMSTLIDDLLSFARVPVNSQSVNLVSLDHIVKGVLSDLEMAIKESRAVINIGTLPNIFGEASQLRQLLQNLLGNALKFRHVDRLPVISINVQTILSTTLPSHVKPLRESVQYHKLEVSDNGIGFDNNASQKIFQVFQRLHGKNAYSGSGIGLSICEKITSNHGGAITAFGTPNEGSIFSVYLPVPSGTTL